MDDELSALQIQEQVFPPSLQTLDALSDQRLWGASQRPPQGLAHAQSRDRAADERGLQTQAGDLNFWKFWHAGIVLEAPEPSPDCRREGVVSGVPRAPCRGCPWCRT